MAEERLREFVGRQMALREKLRWAAPRSARRRRLQAELDALVREELQREAARLGRLAGTPGPYGDRAPWWVER